MDSSRMGQRGQALQVETMEMILKKVKEDLTYQTYTFEKEKDELEKSKKELEKSIAKNTGLLVKAFTNPELSNLQMKIANSISEKEVVESRLEVLVKLLEFIKEITKVIESGPSNMSRERMETICRSNWPALKYQSTSPLGKPF